ncbi:MAG: glycosyltransferase family A protein [Patescibacteria group bacterium]|nr:glycosyltransferase family A protein [Patescibacteria group bacterium]
MPRLSVIIPTYQDGKLISQTIESILDQNFKDFEIIVVVDGSTDDTLENLKCYKNKIKIFYQTNQGAPAARNRGLREANPNSEFIIFCDSDMILYETAFEKMIQILEQHPDKSYVYSSFRWGSKKFKLHEFDAMKLKQENYIHTSSMIRRCDFSQQGWDESLKRFQDWDLWLTMLEQGKTGKWIDEILFYFSPGKNRISSWLPKFVYKIPWQKIGWAPTLIQKYFQAKKIIQKKHTLDRKS